jgi:hypothetical protein
VAADFEAVRAEAVSALAAALARQEGAGAALRWCWYRNPVFAAVLFTQAVQWWFGAGCDVRVVTRFVGRVRASRPAEPLSFPSREAEALIRAGLGEVALLEAVDPERISYPEIGIAVLEGLFAEWQPGPDQVARLFSQVEAVMQAARELSPGLDAAQEDWFAAGMHDSPLAALLATWPTGDTPP